MKLFFDALAVVSLVVAVDLVLFAALAEEYIFLLPALPLVFIALISAGAAELAKNR